MKYVKNVFEISVPDFKGRKKNLRLKCHYTETIRDIYWT